MIKINPIYLVVVFLLAIASYFFLKKFVMQPVKDPSVLIVGTAADFPPFEFERNEEIVGFEIDLVKEIGKKLNMGIELKNLDFNLLLLELKSRRIDMIASAMTATPEKEKTVLFTRPFLKDDRFIILSLKKNKISKGILDLKDKLVVVNDGYTAEKYMEDQKKIHPEIELKRSPNVISALLELSTEKVYAFVTAKSAVKQWLKKRGEENFSVFELEDSDDYSLVISKDNEKLFDDVQKALDELEKDKTIDKLKKKWDLT